MRYILFFAIITLLMTACKDEFEKQIEMQLPISLCLPASEIAVPLQSPSRERKVFGDPGTNEKFALPRYAYFFIFQKYGEHFYFYKMREEKLDIDEWSKERYVGPFETEGDSIYRCTKIYRIVIEKGSEGGRLYAMASNKRLTFSASINESSTLDDVLNLKFMTSPDSIQENLQNIYSSPYNYIHPTKGDYYGSFQVVSSAATLNLLLYHVASKVDIKWNVADSVRIKANPAQAVRLTYMEARRLYNSDAYCFKPMKNMLSSLPAAGEGYTIPDIVTPNDEGLWWEGRSYFYTIPYYVAGEARYFPLQMLLGTNGTKESAGYELTLNQPLDTSSAFVPWIRGNFNFSQPLEDKSVVLTAVE